MQGIKGRSRTVKYDFSFFIILPLWQQDKAFFIFGGYFWDLVGVPVDINIDPQGHNNRQSVYALPTQSLFCFHFSFVFIISISCKSYHTHTICICELSVKVFAILLYLFLCFNRLLCYQFCSPLLSYLLSV